MRAQFALIYSSLMQYQVYVSLKSPAGSWFQMALFASTNRSAVLFVGYRAKHGKWGDMEAVSRPFSQIISGAKQFVIPVFQRDYSWGPEQCRQMWSDILSSGDESQRTHFLGSFVYIEGNAGAAFSSWLVIDGQQRITTLTVLMIALRDHIRETGWDGDGDGPTQRRIDAYFLKNTEESGDRQYRLALRRRDNSTLQTLVDEMDTSDLADSFEHILDAYQCFRDLLRSPGVDPARVYEGVHHLVVVDVKLHRGIDNPQLIFESFKLYGSRLDPKRPDPKLFANGFAGGGSNPAL